MPCLSTTDDWRGEVVCLSPSLLGCPDRSISSKAVGRSATSGFQLVCQCGTGGIHGRG